MTTGPSDGKDMREQDLRNLGQAAAELSHELRNLLVVVLAHADLLIEGKSEDPKILAENIQRAAISCKELVDDVLSLAVDRQVTLVPIDLVTVLDHMARLQVAKPGLSVIRNLETEDAWVLGRASDLERLLLNLIRNAEEASPKGRVELRLSKSPGGFVLSIDDDGPGIPQDLREKVFLPFFSETKSGGTGLGLTLVRRIAEQHGATLQVTESRWKGASFVLEIPQLKQALPPEVDVEVDAPAMDESLNILCVDDDDSTLETYQMILKLEGHEITCAHDARQALLEIESRNFDALLVDLRLPDMRAPELLKRIRDVRPQLAKRVIFATGDLMNEESRKFLDATGNPYLSKPFRIEQLRLAIDLVVRGL